MLQIFSGYSVVIYAAYVRVYLNTYLIKRGNQETRKHIMGLLVNKSPNTLQHILRTAWKGEDKFKCISSNLKVPGKRVGLGPNCRNT
jgi:hypothetical protein